VGLPKNSATTDFTSHESHHLNCFNLRFFSILVKINGERMRDKLSALQRIRSIANYQFGKGVGERLFPDDVRIVLSKRTGRIRHVYLDENRLATLRPPDGLFSLTITGAKRIMEGAESPRLWVKVQKEAAPFIAKGKSFFAKHVMDADDEIRPHEEVIVIDEENEVLAVGKAMLSGREMKAFKRGVAVRVRRGAAEVKKTCGDYGK